MCSEDTDESISQENSLTLLIAMGKALQQVNVPGKMYTHID